MNLTPYDAPTYFPTSYFATGAHLIGPDDGAGSTLGRTPYYAPTYFPTAYFSGPRAAETPPAPLITQAPAGRDGGAYAALLAALRDAREFASVRSGDPSRRDDAGADASPRAIVIPQGWEESDEADPALLVRRVWFLVRLTVRLGDDLDPFDELDRLTRVVQARVDRSDLGGTCLPGLTRIKAGRYRASDTYPEWSIDLDGEFTTLVDPAST